MFLIPFYIFTYEERFAEYEQDTAKLESLKLEYEQIKNRLEELMVAGAISEYTVTIHSHLHLHAQNQPAELAATASQFPVLLMWVEVPDSSHR